MNVKIRKGVCLGICMALCMTACSLGETKNSEEGTIMSNWQEQALALSGTDMEEFAPELATPGEQRLMEQAEFVQQYLGEKYPGVEFEMTACIPKGLTQSADRFVMCVAGAPELSFDVDAEDGSATDSYYGLLKTEEYEDYLEAQLKEIGVEAGVYSTIIAMLPKEFGADMPIETAAVTGDFFSHTWILLPPGDFENQCAQVQAMIEERGMGGKFTVYGLLEPLPEGVTKAQVDQMIPAHTEAQPVYESRKTFNVFCR